LSQSIRNPIQRTALTAVRNRAAPPIRLAVARPVVRVGDADHLINVPSASSALWLSESWLFVGLSQNSVNHSLA